LHYFFLTVICLFQEAQQTTPDSIPDNLVENMELTPSNETSGKENIDGRKSRGYSMRKKHLREVRKKILSLENQLRESRKREQNSLKKLHRHESASRTRKVNIIH